MLTAPASTMARPGRLVAASPRLRLQTWQTRRLWTPWTPVTCTLLAVPWRGKRPQTFADIERPSLIQHQKNSQCLRKTILDMFFFSQAFLHHIPSTYEYVYVSYYIVSYYIILYHILFGCSVLYCFVLL